MAIQTKLRRWGNSIGLVIPIEFLKEKNLREGEEVLVTIDRKADISKLFGSLKEWKIDTQKFKEELRKEEKKYEQRAFSR